MPPAGTVTYRFPDDTKSLSSKDFSDPLTSIARRRGTNFSIDVSFNVFSLTIRRMWDSNPRMTSLPSDGFQDRSLKPDLGNPPQNQSISVFSLGRWFSQIPIQSVTFSFSTESVDCNEIVVSYTIVLYSGYFSRSPSTPTRKSCRFGHKSVH